MFGIFDAFLAEFDRRSRSRRTGITLATLSDDQLKDIGLTRADVAALTHARRAVDDGRRGGVERVAEAGYMQLAVVGRSFPQTR